MLLAKEECPALLRCPVTHEELVFEADGSSRARKSRRHYESVQDIPILIDFETSVIDRDGLLKSSAASSIHRPRYNATAFAKRLLSPPKRQTKINVELLIKELRDKPKALVLIIGGGTVGQGMEPLYDHSSIKVVSFDIYRTEQTQFIADAHAVPLGDASVDAVVIQAVLEHVLCPEKVVQEIWRVLRPGGLVYAETPFLQQVHEGPYDFTRFTESGHRYLFRRFGMVASDMANQAAALGSVTEDVMHHTRELLGIACLTPLDCIELPDLFQRGKASDREPRLRRPTMNVRRGSRVAACEIDSLTGTPLHICDHEWCCR